MKQFKNVFIFGIISLLLIGVMIIHHAAPSRMVDFRGEILCTAVSEDGTVTLFAANDLDGVFVFRIDDKSKLENCCGEGIAIDDLIKGAMVDINYRKHLFKKEDIRIVNTLRIYD